MHDVTGYQTETAFKKRGDYIVALNADFKLLQYILVSDSTYMCISQLGVSENRFCTHKIKLTFL